MSKDRIAKLRKRERGARLLASTAASAWAANIYTRMADELAEQAGGADAAE